MQIPHESKEESIPTGYGHICFRKVSPLVFSIHTSHTSIIQSSKWETFWLISLLFFPPLIFLVLLIPLHDCFFSVFAASAFSQSSDFNHDVMRLLQWSPNCSLCFQPHISLAQPFTLIRILFIVLIWLCFFPAVSSVMVLIMQCCRHLLSLLCDKFLEIKRAVFYPSHGSPEPNTSTCHKIGFQ